MRRWLHRCLPYVLLSVAVGLVLFSSLENGFTNWDDNYYVSDNPSIRHLDLQSVARMFHPRSLTAQGWTPLVTLTHAVEYRLFGLNPLPYHATNLLLHIGATLVVFALLVRVGAPPIVAFGGALVFGIHPLQVESVVWVSGRKNVLSTLFGFAAVLVYLRGTPRAYGGALALFILSCLSKGIAVVVPPLLVATLLSVGRGVGWRREALRLTPFFLLALIRGLWTVEVQSDVWARTAVLSLGSRMAIMGEVQLTYLRQLFLPTDLRPFYEWTSVPWTELLPLAGWGLTVALSMAVAWRSRRLPWVGLLGAIVAITLFPMLNVFPAPFFQADRYVYMAVPGAAGLAVYAAYELGRFLRRSWVAPTLLAIWCGGVLTPLTLRQIPVWSSSYTLWNHTLRHEPGWYAAFNNLGMWYLRQERIDEAISAFEQCLAVRPGFLEAKLGLGLSHLSVDHLDEAERRFREIVAAEPDLFDEIQPKALQGLGQVLHRRGAFEAAEVAYRKAITRSPEGIDAITNLGSLLYDRERYVEAVRLYDRAIELRPELAAAYNNRGNALRKLGRTAEAASSIQAAIKLDPDYAGAYSNLGALFVDVGRPQQAIPQFQRALDADPELAEALSNLGNAYFSLGNMDSALGAYERALEIEPELAEALNNAGNALVVMRRHHEAQTRYRQALELQPGFAEAQYGLGRSLLESGHPAVALPLLEEAHRAMPDWAPASSKLAHAAWKTGNLELAARSFKHLIQLEPARLPAYYNLSKVYVELDRTDEAEGALRRAIERAEAPVLLEELASLLARDPGGQPEAEKLRARAQKLRSQPRSDPSRDPPSR